MKIKVLLSLTLLSVSFLSWGQVGNTQRIETLEHQVSSLQNDIWQYKNDLLRQLNALKKDNDSLQIANDSLKTEQANLAHKLSTAESKLNGKIDEANGMIKNNSNSLNTRTWSGGAIALALLLFGLLLYWLLGKRLRKSNDGLESIKDAQDALQKANGEIQEKSIELDKKLVELLNKQFSSQQQQNTANNSSQDKTVDHSFALKVGDEIAKIETNLSKMDPSVRGYTQLKQALNRIKDNFNAHGYEIVDLLGKDYNDGMPFEAQFIPDDTLPEGKRIITGISRLQINYNGEMIQPAKIVVRENI